MNIIKFGYRNIYRQKRRSLLTMLTMFGGFTLAAISIGWSDGSYRFIIERFTSNEMGQIEIHHGDYLDMPKIYKTIDDYDTIAGTLDSMTEVEYNAPRVYSAGLAAVGDKSASARIIGIDPARETPATRFDKKIIKGSNFSDSAQHQTVLGKGLARTLGADIGDSLIILSQGADGSIANDIYEIIGIMASGNDMNDRIDFYLHIRDAQDLLVLNGRIHEVAVFIGNIENVQPVTAQIRSRLDDASLNIAPWQEFAKSFYTAMKADQQGGYIMLFVINLIVAVGVLNTVLMTVLERTREYGVLRAVGTRPGQIVALVLIEVSILAVISIILGAICGSILNAIVAAHGITIPEPFTYGGIEFNKMYSEVSLRTLYIPAVTVLLTAFIVSIFPAAKAARVRPAKAMRTH